MSLPPWASDAAAKRRQNRSSASQERRHAQAVGGKVQAGSGSSWRAKGDVRSLHFMDELKQTSKKSYAITIDVIHKIIKAAQQSDREPRLIIDFTDYGIRAVVTFEDSP